MQITSSFTWNSNKSKSWGHSWYHLTVPLSAPAPRLGIIALGMRRAIARGEAPGPRQLGQNIKGAELGLGLVFHIFYKKTELMKKKGVSCHKPLRKDKKICFANNKQSK